MSTSEPESQHESTAPPDATDPAEIHAQIAVLEAENARLREEYTRARQVTYWRTAIALLGVGVIGLLGGLVFPDARVVLFALGGTGVFAGVLTYFLTPEQFISGRVGARVFQALIEDRDAAIDELGLAGDPVYMPGDEVRLFVPRTDTEQLPDRSDLTDLFVVPTNPKRGGVAFHSTGDALLEEVTAVRDQSLDEAPGDTAAVLADAVVELFELADGVDYDVDEATNRVTFTVDGAGFGDPTKLDHPVVSVFAAGLARALDKPIRTEIGEEDPLTVTCRYE